VVFWYQQQSRKDRAREGMSQFGDARGENWFLLIWIWIEQSWRGRQGKDFERETEC
jgi:hypothetical protein